MARYLKTSSVFTPVDYATRIEPIKEYTTRYNEIQNNLSDIGALGDAIGGLINPDNEADRELLNTYNSFKDQIVGIASDMMSRGNVNDAAYQVGKLKGIYANQLAPIERGYNAWQEAIKAYDKAKTANPTFLGTDPRKYGITSYLNGDSPNDWYTTGSDIQKDALVSAAAQSSRMDRHRFVTERGYLFRINETGVDANTAQRVIDALEKHNNGENNVKASLSIDNARGINEQELFDSVKQIYDDSINKYGINNFGEGDNFEKAKGYIYDGIFEGLTSKYSETPLQIHRETTSSTSTKTKTGDGLTLPDISGAITHITKPVQNVDFNRKMAKAIDKYDVDFNNQTVGGLEELNNKNFDSTKYSEILDENGNIKTYSQIYRDAVNNNASNAELSRLNRLYNDALRDNDGSLVVNVVDGNNKVIDDVKGDSKYRKLRKLFKSYGLDIKENTIDELESKMLANPALLDTPYDISVFKPELKTAISDQLAAQNYSAPILQYSSEGLSETTGKRPKETKKIGTTFTFNPDNDKFNGIVYSPNDNKLAYSFTHKLDDGTSVNVLTKYDGEYDSIANAEKIKGIIRNTFMDKRNPQQMSDNALDLFYNDENMRNIILSSFNELANHNMFTSSDIYSIKNDIIDSKTGNFVVDDYGNDYMAVARLITLVNARYDDYLNLLFQQMFTRPIKE